MVAMSIDCGPVRAKHLLHDLGANLDILQTAADGNESAYMVKVNGIPEVELHMTMYGSGAVVEMRIDGEAVDEVEVDCSVDFWIAKAHKAVEQMLLLRYPNAVFAWYTRGPNAE
jgi:hypothetical protein